MPLIDDAIVQQKIQQTYLNRRMQESECWLGLAKGEWVGGRDSFNWIKIQDVNFMFAIDIDPTFKISKNG